MEDARTRAHDAPVYARVYTRGKTPNFEGPYRTSQRDTCKVVKFSKKKVQRTIFRGRYTLPLQPSPLMMRPCSLSAHFALRDRIS